MADINYSSSDAGYNLSTGPAPSFTAPAGGDLNALFQQLAARKAKADLDKKREEQYRYNVESKWAQEMHDAQLRALQPQAPQAPPRELSLRERGLVEQKMGLHGLVDYVDPLNLKPSEQLQGLGGVYGRPGGNFQQGAYARAGGGFGFERAL